MRSDRTARPCLIADVVAAARRTKRVVAVADGLMASAAFWIASQAHDIVGSSSSQVGSIGVVALHTDVSRAEEAAGLRTTVLTSARNKAEGDPHQPLTAEARATLQARVDQAGAMFTAAVARGRRVSVETASGPKFGEGRAYFAAEARRRGLIDRVATIDEVLAREITCPRPRRPMSEEAALLRLRLAEHGF